MVHIEILSFVPAMSLITVPFFLVQNHVLHVAVTHDGMCLLIQKSSSAFHYLGIFEEYRPGDLLNVPQRGLSHGST